MDENDLKEALQKLRVLVMVYGPSAAVFALLQAIKVALRSLDGGT